MRRYRKDIHSIFIASLGLKSKDRSVHIHQHENMQEFYIIRIITIEEQKAIK